MPTEPSQTETKIVENARGPKSASVDGQSVTQHSIGDQIKADRYEKSQEAARGGGLGIRRARVSLPGGQS